MTYLVRRNPVREMIATHNAMNRLFEESFSRPFARAYWASDRNGIQPLALDVFENDDNFVVEANIPGFAAEDVDIAIQDNVVTIKAEIKIEENSKDDQDSEVETEAKPVYHLRERRIYRNYKRSITLPVDVNAESAEASVQDGVLTLTLPKVEEVKPKRIEVKVS